MKRDYYETSRTSKQRTDSAKNHCTCARSKFSQHEFIIAPFRWHLVLSRERWPEKTTQTLCCRREKRIRIWKERVSSQIPERLRQHLEDVIDDASAEEGLINVQYNGVLLTGKG